MAKPLLLDEIENGSVVARRESNVCISTALVAGYCQDRMDSTLDEPEWNNV